MTPRQTVIILDACVLINFANTQSLSLFSGFMDTDFLTTANVMEEVTYPCQHEALQSCIKSGCLKVVELTDPETMKDFLSLRKRLGKGESSCIAMASANKWIVCSDDRKRVPGIVQQRLGKAYIITTEDLLGSAVSRGIIQEHDMQSILTSLKNISEERVKALLRDN